MKIGGKKIEHAPASEYIVFPRENGPIAFKITALMDREQFDKYCPEPKVPVALGRGGKKIENPTDRKYIQAVERHGKQFMDFMFISSLSAPNPKKGQPNEPDDLPIEWELLQLGDKNTWHRWEEELRSIGLSDMERKRLFNKVMEVNSLSDARMKEARDSFLLPQEEELSEFPSSSTEQEDTQSGELVKD